MLFLWVILRNSCSWLVSQFQIQFPNTRLMGGFFSALLCLTCFFFLPLHADARRYLVWSFAGSKVTKHRLITSALQPFFPPSSTPSQLTPSSDDPFDHNWVPCYLWLINTTTTYKPTDTFSVNPLKFREISFIGDQCWVRSFVELLPWSGKSIKSLLDFLITHILYLYFIDTLIMHAICSFRPTTDNLDSKFHPHLLSCGWWLAGAAACWSN